MAEVLPRLSLPRKRPGRAGERKLKNYLTMKWDKIYFEYCRTGRFDKAEELEDRREEYRQNRLRKQNAGRRGTEQYR